MSVYLDTHALNVVKVFHEALCISTKSELVAGPVMLEIGAVGFIIGRVTVNITI